MVTDLLSTFFILTWIWSGTLCGFWPLSVLWPTVVFVLCIRMRMQHQFTNYIRRYTGKWCDTCLCCARVHSTSSLIILAMMDDLIFNFSWVTVRCVFISHNIWKQGLNFSLSFWNDIFRVITILKVWFWITNTAIGPSFSFWIMHMDE